jgi:hypothetical protein
VRPGPKRASLTPRSTLAQLAGQATPQRCQNLLPLLLHSHPARAGTFTAAAPWHHTLRDQALRLLVWGSTGKHGDEACCCADLTIVPTRRFSGIVLPTVRATRRLTRGPDAGCCLMAEIEANAKRTSLISSRNRYNSHTLKSRGLIKCSP